MTAHAMMHGGGVLLLTGSLTLALVETASHFGIDVAKCLNKISIHTDQLLHLGLKIIYVIVVFH